MSNPTLLIRADANLTIGTGHVMRCLALAQAWQDAGGEAVFAAAELPEALQQKILSQDFSVARVPAPGGTAGDAEFTAEAASQKNVEWVVVDGDHFGVDFLRRVQSSGRRLLLIDDFARRDAFPADLILNPNLGVTELAYRSRGTKAPLLVGQSYALLRREFSSWKGSRVFPDKGNRVLVTLGGSDPENLTPHIVQALDDLDGYEITAVIGPGSVHAPGFHGVHSPKVRMVSNPPDMRLAMEQSDLAIIAAGGTLWELLFMQCVVLSYARNPVQASVIEYLQRAGAVRDMGATADFRGPALVAAVVELASSVTARKKMADVGRRIVDGEGTARVIRALRTRGDSA